MKKLILVIATVFAIPAANAEWLGGSEGIQIDYIHVAKSGAVRVYAEGGSWGGNLCTDQSHFLLQASTNGYDAIYSLLMSAMISRRNVRVQTVTCQGPNSLPLNVQIR